jgi:hypothetical protein
MIDKIDRPDAHSPYRIGEAKQTKEDQHQQQNPKEELERQYQKRIEGKEWSKFGRKTTVVKPLHLPREEIARCVFRSVSLHSGTGILQVDVHVRDGRTIRGALMLITKLEEFIQLKKLLPGQLVAEELWAKGPTIEMGIVQHLTEAGLPGEEIRGRPSPARKEVPARRSWIERAGLVDRQSRRTNWGLAALLLLLLGLIILTMALMLR